MVRQPGLSTSSGQRQKLLFLGRAAMRGWGPCLGLTCKGKATHPASASALLHPRCKCGCREVPHSTWHNSNVDEEIQGGAKLPAFPQFMQEACY